MHFHRNPIRDFIIHSSKQNTIPHHNVYRSGFMAPCYKYERAILHATRSYFGADVINVSSVMNERDGVCEGVAAFQSLGQWGEKKESSL